MFGKEFLEELERKGSHLRNRFLIYINVTIPVLILALLEMVPLLWSFDIIAQIFSILVVALAVPLLILFTMIDLAAYKLKII